jgi:hypothetical protein
VISITSTTTTVTLWSTIIATISIHEGSWYVALPYSIGSCSPDSCKEYPDSPMNTRVVSDDCNPTAIVTTTTFRTTNVSVVAPYFADLDIIDSNLEASEDLILTIERYVHVMCFVMPVSSCSTVLVLSGPAFGIHFSLIPNSPPRY